MKVTFKTWAKQCVSDIRRLTRPDMPMRLANNFAGLVVVSRPREVWRVADLNPWLLMGEQYDPTGYHPLELLCAHRCPDTMDEMLPAPTTPQIVMEGSANDPWMRWTRFAAAGLAAHVSWVRFLWHALQPLSLMHHPRQEMHHDWAVEWWGDLLGVDYPRAKRQWHEVLWEAQTLRTRQRFEFWNRECDEKLLWA